MSSEDMNANMATTENENNVAENNELNELREHSAFDLYTTKNNSIFAIYFSNRK